MVTNYRTPDRGDLTFRNNSVGWISAVPLLDADRKLLRSPLTMATRRRLVPLLLMAQPQFEIARPFLPSYVNAAIEQVSAALEQWQHDEETAILEQ